MDRKFAALVSGVFLVSVAIGFSFGSPQDQGSDRFRQDVSFTANSSNPIEEVFFDERNISLIVQPDKEADFYLNVNKTVTPLEGLKHDGEVHQLRDFVTVDGEMYLLEMRYHDDAEVEGDEWITLYRVTKL